MMLCNPLGLSTTGNLLTRNPDGLRELEAFFVAQIGPYWLGVVGDGSHTNGYHLGAFEDPPGDYSTIHPRDIAGIKQFGGYFAAACDIGMQWQASRLWFTWLIGQLREGKFPDITEVIGSADGVQDYRYTSDDGFVYGEIWSGNHIEHTHISFFRDSIMRSHVYLFDSWTATGRITKVASKPTPVISVKPSPSASAAPVRVESRGSSGTSLRGAFLACGLGAFAWLIKRRVEVAREDSQQDSG